MESGGGLTIICTLRLGCRAAERAKPKEAPRSVRCPRAPDGARLALARTRGSGAGKVTKKRSDTRFGIIFLISFRLGRRNDDTARPPVVGLAPYEHGLRA